MNPEENLCEECEKNCHVHTCQQCDKLIEAHCDCKQGPDINVWCSSNCRAAFDL